MALYAQVIIDIAHTNVDRVFAYSIPAEEAIEVGQRVLVPFGRGNTAKEGYVIALWMCQKNASSPSSVRRRALRPSCQNKCV